MGGAATAAAVISGGTKLYELQKAKKRSEKELKHTATQRELARRKSKNLLEQNMAERRAKLSNLGILNSNSSLAVAKRLYKDSLLDAKYKDLAYQEKEEDIKSNYRNNRDNFITGTISNMTSSSNSILK